jgi:SAM-dependent methyltransferase
MAEVLDDIVLDQPLKTGYQSFLRLCLEVGADLSVVHSRVQSLLSLRHVSQELSDIFDDATGQTASSPNRGRSRPTNWRRYLLPLERRWYESLEQGKPDYSVYDGDEYLADSWACWEDQSRGYLRAIQRIGIAETFKPGSRIVDLGCGFGITTAVFSQMIPESRVTGTNLETSRQMVMAQKLASTYGFSMTENLSEIGQSDIVFASEYFEHFRDPASHLTEVLSELKPAVLIVANTFTQPSVGHFDTIGYQHWGRPIPNESVTPAFSSVLRDQGYATPGNGKGRLWNGRPAVWKKTR